ncbi:hypothetical protein BaRGS_00016466 [Batillaria attramentaria]|uniref:maleylacetoacetate isomerase n=1 Tax=Batillaria attramentaria TaxID=370345 RepID=A0ABD0KZY2_9CAEN
MQLVLSISFYRFGCMLASTAPVLGEFSLLTLCFTPLYCAALELKKIPYEREDVDLRNLPADFVRLNPRKQVPVVVIDGKTFSQSLAILEHLEERWSDKPLLPSDPVQRTQAREIANAIISGIQPLQNGGGPLPKLLEENLTGMTALEWNKFWVNHGFTALEQNLGSTAGKYCVGDEVSFADLCLVPQYINARDRFKMDVSKYPTIQKIAEHCLSTEPFKSVCKV